MIEMLLSRSSGSKAGQAVGANIATHATCDGMLLTMKDHLMCNKLISSAEASRAFRAILPDPAHCNIAVFVLSPTSDQHKRLQGG